MEEPKVELQEVELKNYDESIISFSVFVDKERIETIEISEENYQKLLDNKPIECKECYCRDCFFNNPENCIFKNRIPPKLSKKLINIQLNSIPNLLDPINSNMVPMKINKKKMVKKINN